MTETELEEIKRKSLKTFDKKFSEYVVSATIGQYNAKGVNIGYIPVKTLVREFVKSCIDKAYKEGWEDSYKEIMLKSSLS